MKKIFRHSKMQDTKRFKGTKKIRNYLPLVNLSLRCRFLEAAVCRCFSGAFFNKVAGLLLQNTCSGCFWIFVAANTFFSDKYYIHWRQLHQFLSQTPLKKRVKPQKQSLQLFCKQRCSQKFCKFHSETPVLKSLFNRVAGLQACNYIKKRPNIDVFLWSLRNFQHT